MPSPRYVEVRSLVTVNCKERRYSIYLNSPQELASHGIALLVEELGTVEARQFVLDELGKYHENYRGTERDFRDAKMPKARLYDGANSHTMGYPWSAAERAPASQHPSASPDFDPSADS